jgi:hypothetical protein
MIAIAKQSMASSLPRLLVGIDTGRLPARGVAAAALGKAVIGCPSQMPSRMTAERVRAGRRAWMFLAAD